MRWNLANVGLALVVAHLASGRPLAASPVEASPKGVPRGTAQAPKTAVHDRDVGAVRTFVRTVTIDLEACRRAFQVYTLPSLVAAQGQCRVPVVTGEPVSATVQTSFHAETREVDGEAVVRRLTFSGDGRSYAITYYDRDGIRSWEAALSRIRPFLEAKVGGGRYETLVTKVVLDR
jgi:hypothetical protein